MDTLEMISKCPLLGIEPGVKISKTVFHQMVSTTEEYPFVAVPTMLYLSTGHPLWSLPAQ